MSEIPKQYDHHDVEQRVQERWREEKPFAATPDERDQTYVVMMPLPNVTGALHMGHAMDNVMQDLLTRWHRMAGDNTLWMAGTDHAGIATQSVVEKRLFELEGKTRHDVGRDELVRRIWEWKDQYQQRIVQQQQAMGCGCDWDRQRFTMDAICARAVRWTFFRMFREGLIYQGNRLVNWDCHLQTAVADDELYRAPIQGHFWHLRYPVIDPQPGEPTHIVVATTRPETMLGDTAVACHPEPAAALDTLEAKAKERLAEASAKDRPELEAELERLARRRTEHLPNLETVAAMARAGRQVQLPLQDRPIPLILDEWAKPELGSGCVKITPAHDPNDYEVWQRHRDAIEIRNVLNPDGSIAESGGSYAGLDRFAARKQIVADLDAAGLLQEVEDREIEIDHSDRSKTIVEPYLSKQWFVRMGDVEGGVLMGRGTEREFRSPGLAQAAMDAADGTWRTPTGRAVRFHPDQERYHKIYHSWLVEKRDWCISRQLWWGHRIPVWRGVLERDKLLDLRGALEQFETREDVASFVVLGENERVAGLAGIDALADRPELDRVEVLVCFRDEERDRNMGSLLRSAGMEMETDVLDTWFSSALWPHSTLGWPDPENAAIDAGQSPMAAAEGRPDTLSYYYPGSCLVTGRDIITLWVARMVITGLYNLGDVPFTDVFLHANILDGKGERMSKSKGNGIDPVDIIERYGADAMRYVLCEMQTGTQDIRLPVQAISPFDGEPIDLAQARPGSSSGCYIDARSGKEFDVVGLMEDQGVPQAKTISERFEVGRGFANKLWNAARFALMNLEEFAHDTHARAELELEDRWILSRMHATIERVQAGLQGYNPSAAIGAAREFFWNDLCDWYLELSKPRMRDADRRGAAQRVLATALDQVLRLFHPFVPFITEELWSRLAERAPERGVLEPLTVTPSLALAPWPVADAGCRDEAVESDLSFTQELVSSVREVRARYNVPPSQRIQLVLRAAGENGARAERCQGLIAHMAGADRIELDPDAERPKNAAQVMVRDVEGYVLGVIDPEKERAKLEKELGKLKGQMQGVEKKLGNQGFVAKAPAEVVEKERQLLQELGQRIESIERTLAEL